jgi:hypothetical protein
MFLPPFQVDRNFRNFRGSVRFTPQWALSQYFTSPRYAKDLLGEP